VDVTMGTRPDSEPSSEPAGLVSYRKRNYGTQAYCWEIGIALLPQWRGRGIGWRAQAIFCSYLFENTPVQRIEAATHAENIPEQRSLEKAGFTLEGVIRAAEFRAGQWRDGYLYSRLRTDPAPDPLKG
jgi:RimJ/RimL family protein N-acetyltransferase